MRASSPQSSCNSASDDSDAAAGRLVMSSLSAILYDARAARGWCSITSWICPAPWRSIERKTTSLVVSAIDDSAVTSFSQSPSTR